MIRAASVAALAAALGGCASIDINGDHVHIEPGLRNIAVCFDETTGLLDQVLVYPLSKTFAGQNMVLGTFAGAAFGGGAGAAAGGLVGLASDLVSAAPALVGENPVPSCSAPEPKIEEAPPLRPSESEIVPSRGLPDRTLWSPMAVLCGGPAAPSFCLP